MYDWWDPLRLLKQRGLQCPAFSALRFCQPHFRVRPHRPKIHCRFSECKFVGEKLALYLPYVNIPEDIAQIP